MSFEDLQHEVFTAIEEVLFGDEDPSKYEIHNPSPLDPRAKTAGWYIKNNCLIVETYGVRALDYYGGFEYIDQDYRMNVGPYTIYSGDAPRVQQIIEANSED